jgi:hypothetical protein
MLELRCVSDLNHLHFTLRTLGMPGRRRTATVAAGVNECRIAVEGVAVATPCSTTRSSCIVRRQRRASTATRKRRRDGVIVAAVTAAAIGRLPCRSRAVKRLSQGDRPNLWRRK